MSHISREATTDGGGDAPKDPVPPLKAAGYRQIERFVGPLTSKILAVSEFDRRLALDAGIVTEDRIVTVHNGMPDVPPRLRGDRARTPARLVMVARFSAQKDHPLLLHALAGLQDRYIFS